MKELPNHLQDRLKISTNKIAMNYYNLSIIAATLPRSAAARGPSVMKRSNRVSGSIGLILSNFSVLNTNGVDKPNL
jgi:hypothetical protein